jgi:OmpA-OmpF porin, OOP family
MLRQGKRPWTAAVFFIMMRFNCKIKGIHKKGFGIMRRQHGMKIIGTMVGVILLAACAGEPLKVEPIAKSENPAALVEKLGQGLAAARENRVDQFSPTWFSSAQDSYLKAKSGIDKGTQLSDILENIATGQAQLQQALLFAQKTKSALAGVIQSRDAAAAAHANQYGKEYARLEEDFAKLAEAVENNDGGYVRSKSKPLNDAYRALELRAIKDAALGRARSMIAAARSQKLDKAAPKSFLIAQSKLADAEAVITRDRYAKEQIAAAVQEAEFYAQRMQQVAQTDLKVEEMVPEDITLWMENYFTQTLASLKQPDRRNLSFDDQQEAIEKAVTNLQRNQSSTSSQVQAKDIEIEKLKQRINDLEGRTYQEQADKERLAAEKQFNELYNKVQGYFSPDQAEVYKKAQQLVIRLKAIQFPVGQAIIVPGNYPLLTTVQKAIATFNKPDVVIEGHTDSTGSEVANQQLSQKRAEAVRQYLIYNGTLPANKIASVGYGSSRPLASNATAQGRAINRRIDVIIKPLQH